MTSKTNPNQQTTYECDHCSEVFDGEPKVELDCPAGYFAFCSGGCRDEFVDDAREVAESGTDQ